MPIYVEVIVNVPRVDGGFDYLVPEDLENEIREGCLVVVPFGKQLVQGIVTRYIEVPQVSETKPIDSVLDSNRVVTQNQIKLAKWMADQNLGRMSTYLHAMLPPGVSQIADTVYSLNPGREKSQTANTDLQSRLVTLLQNKGPLRSRQIDRTFPHVKWKESMLGLVKKGQVIKKGVLLPPQVRPKMAKMVYLNVPPNAVENKRDEMGRQGTKAFTRRIAILECLVDEPWPVPVSKVIASSGGNLQDIKWLAGLGLVNLTESEIWRDPLENIEFVDQGIPTLTDEQALAWENISTRIREIDSIKNPDPIMLFGVTGSGKTELYLQAVAETIKKGKQAIILVPEISLTPQTVRRFLSRFPGEVGLIHSQLSVGERYDTWRKVRDGALKVIVGPRSALFVPFDNLGLIVVDEFHDESYAQDDLPPAYSGVSTAIEYGKMNAAVVILGSATPDITLKYQADLQKWPILRLSKRVLVNPSINTNSHPSLDAIKGGQGENEIALPPVSVVDMRQELKSGNRSIFSRTLRQSLQQVLEANQQAILLLNRKGTATYIFCRSCGYSLRCPRCETPLTFHGSQSLLLCHSCNYQRKMPEKCPVCGSNQIRQMGTGTEKVVQELQNLFPDGRIVRLDAETTRQKGAHELLLTQFAQHGADFLVGTQMLAKGLDIPLVTLVGVVLADIGMNLPDYRAAERTFQLLTQVAGRAGRSQLGGQVIFQTFMPENDAIRAASTHNYAEFYQHELSNRKKINYPPFVRLIRLEYRSLHADQAEAHAKSMSKNIDLWINENPQVVSEIVGPVPCFYAKVNNQYRWQILLKGSDPIKLLKDKKLGDWRVTVDPVNIL